MKYLNLTQNFNPFKSESDGYIHYDYSVFSGGEPHIKIKTLIGDTFPHHDFGGVMITIKINTFNDVGKLMVAVDALKRLMIENEQNTNIHLFVPYFPGARQDRIMVNGEAFTAKVYADIINSMGFKTVTIVDPHSDVTPTLINNCIVIDNHEFVSKAMAPEFGYYRAPIPYIVSPDAGSNKKVQKLVKYLSEYKPFEIVKCDKIRDVKTGNITDFEVYRDDLVGLDCVIIDDICDGGRTFVGLAKELKKKNAGKLYLIITHGIFSYGVDELLKYYEKIYTTDSFGDEFAGVEIIELRTILN